MAELSTTAAGPAPVVLPASPLHRSAAPVVVIGAGPIGLAAAAHLVQRGLPVQVFEAGDRVGAHLASYHQVRLFSPWRYNIDRAARALLLAEGWQPPADEALPTAGELVEQYLEPLARSRALAGRVQLGARVLAVSRARFDKVKTAGREQSDFLLQIVTAEGVQEQRARAVIDATGTWGQPNPLGVHGLPALGEQAAQDRIAHGMPDILGRDRWRYAGRRVLVVGAGHSAAGNLLALATLAEQAPDTRIVWAVRGTDLRRLFGGGENDGLPARGELGLRLQRLVAEGRLDLRRGFGIREIQAGADGLRVLPEDPQRGAIEGVDQIIGATGARPDLALTRELRLRLDPWLESTEALAPLIDPNLHSCGTVRPHGHRELAQPEPGFYAIGAKSYGRAPNFLMATGYEQARSVVAALAGDWVAADDVQLELPETGVCSVDLASPDLTGGGGACCGGPAPTSAPAAAAAASASGCCGGPPRANTSACCVLDEEKKSAGEAGCGCGPRPAATRPGREAPAALR